MNTLRRRFCDYRRRLIFESLEERHVLAAPFAEFVDPDPTIGDGFGALVQPLSTGNVVITAPYDNAGGPAAGAVYLFNGRTGALISTLTGSHANDHVGLSSVLALTTGNFVVASPDWNNGTATKVGAITFGNGNFGVSGIVSASNSLVGTTTNDALSDGGLIPLSNGNYVVNSPFWDNGSATDAGAVTWGSGMSGVHGEVSATNSLVGTSANDNAGSSGVTPLSNGNYVVDSPFWDYSFAFLTDLGAVTWGSGTTGVSGPISTSNSLVGSSLGGDQVGSGGVTALSNGNFVVCSPLLDNGTVTDVGAVTWVNGATGTHGGVATTDSLEGTTAGDQVCSGGVTALSNGNYVVKSSSWDNGAVVDAGAVTWGSGSGGLIGTISSAKSLVGTTAGDDVGNYGITALSNGNYVVASPFWDNGPVQNAGAATFGNGTSGTVGTISGGNSFVGSTADDQVGNGGVTALSNGNYVVISRTWDNGAVVDAGAATWGNGASGTHGTVSATNSLVGTTPNDQVGYSGVTALSNGNYVVRSPNWSNGAVGQAGAVTWGNGMSGITGAVSATNSLVGSTPKDQVGSYGATALTNGNYVVRSAMWNNGGAAHAGAVTWGNGTNGTSGVVTVSNSLVGSTTNDQVGYQFVTALTNGNYVVRSPLWNNGSATQAGAVTWGNGTSGVHGAVSAANSLVGTTKDDEVGEVAVIALSNGNYLAYIPFWHNGSLANAGALTFGSGTGGVMGTINVTNSLIGAAANSNLFWMLDPVNMDFNGAFVAEGRVRVGSQIDGLAHPWHLAAKPLDVNNDTHVAANDVVAVVNYINAAFPSSVAHDAAIGGPYGFLDVNGDDFVAANDALAVINAINAGMGGEGEAAEGRMQNSEGRILSGGVDSALMMLLVMDVNAQTGRRKGA